MEIDFTRTAATLGALVFPDWAVAAQEKAPQDVKETVLITGTTSAVNRSVGGTADQPE